MYKHPTFKKKTPFFPYSFTSALFSELITLTLCTSLGKPKTLEETHLFLASHFPLEREREELAQVRNPHCLPKSQTWVFSASEVACDHINPYISLAMRHHPAEYQHQSKQDPVGNVPTAGSLVHATHTSLCQRPSAHSPPIYMRVWVRFAMPRRELMSR